MQIIWHNERLKSQYDFRQSAEWDGLKIRRARVMPGRMLEHRTEFHEINISVSGHMKTERITETGRRKIYSAGDGGLCITPAGQTVGARWDRPLDNLGFFFDPAFVSQTAVENQLSPNFDFFEDFREKDPLIQHIGLTLLAESESDTPEGRLYADSLIQTLTLHVLKNYSTARSAAEKKTGGLSGYRLRRVKEFIDANLDEDLNLATLAAVADLSQFHFARAFRRSTGLTPQQYLTERRIERAKQLLAREDLPIVEVGLQTGFKNQSHFTTLFRKYTKYTPKVWRELRQ
jgi:AraC family transcriptional regulator